MRAPGFWWRRERGWAAWALAPVGAVVGGVTLWRMARPPRVRAPVPVYCVGNPTVGGAGKTPVALALADALRAVGARPVFLSRGYGGALCGPVVVDRSRHGAADVGDEPLLLAQRAPAVIARDRAAGAALAATLGDAIVMDDGFQNPALFKDWSALLVDAAVGIGNGLATPAGPMRAPYAPQAARASVVLAVDSGEPAGVAVPGALGVRLVPEADVDLSGVRVLAFAGIGRPAKFFASAAALGANVVERRAFGDHEVLSDAAAMALLAAARAGGLTLLTTQKDVARLGASEAHRSLRAAARVVRVRAVLPDEVVSTATRLWREHTGRD